MSHHRPRRPALSRVTALAAFAVLAIAAAPASAAAPSVASEAPDPHIADGTAQRDLDAAREQWKAFGVRSYRMRVSLSCFCSRQVTAPRTLTVRDGRPVRPPRHLRRYATAARLFARVQEAIDGRAATLTVSYGPHGLPREIYVDRSHAIADEEMGVTIRRFRRVG